MNKNLKEVRDAMIAEVGEEKAAAAALIVRLRYAKTKEVYDDIVCDALAMLSFAHNWDADSILVLANRIDAAINLDLPPEIRSVIQTLDLAMRKPEGNA